MEKKTKIIFFIGVVAMIALFFVIVNKNQMPSAYVDEPTVLTQTETEAKYSTVNYMDEENAFCVDVMDDWTKIMMDDYVQFIHSPSKSSLIVSVEPYDPGVNMQSQETVCPSGGNLVMFQMYDNNKLLYQYQINTEDGIYDCTIYQIWDMTRIVTFSFNVKDEYYEQISPKISYMIDSVYFKAVNPIPDDFLIYYDSIRNYSFAYKPTWASSTADNGFAFMDKDTNAVITIEWYQTNETTEYITQMDYTNFASNGRNGFCLNTYQNTGTTISAVAEYNDGNNTRYLMQQYIICTGIYEFIVTIDVPSENQNAFATDINTFLGMFSIYPVNINNSESETQFISDDELQNLLNKAAEAESNQNTTENTEE